MKNTTTHFGYDNLAFFGRINASISHELKNVMAVISETAGLLNDIAGMASAGTSVDPEMLKNSTQSIMEEIQRGFDTVRQMNRFAHSVDVPVDSVNLVELLDLMRKLTGYLAYAGKISLKPCADPQPVALTSPFILQEIIYQALVSSFKNSGPGAEIAVAVEAHNDQAWRIGFDGFCPKESDLFPDERTDTIASSIGIVVHFDRAAARLELIVPKSIESTSAL